MKTSLNRRDFLGALALALPARSLWAQTPVPAPESGPVPPLPPLRRLTKGPRFHWRGYYDKLLFDPSSRFLLANQVDFEGRSPTADDTIRVGMIDLHEGDAWTELGASRAWNWQQGCMLQWRPGSPSEVIWNDRGEDGFVCHLLDVRSGRKRTLPHPVYCLSPDGRTALATDFRRLNDTRPGYGYAGVADPNFGAGAPDDAGIWKLDLASGEQRLIFSLADAVKVPQAGGFPEGAKHWFNHLLFNTDGSRFVFLHRWRAPGQKGWLTRMFSLDPAGREPHLLIPSGKVSHFVWRDAKHVTAYAGHPETGQWCFCVFEDRTRNFTTIGEGVLNRHGDGHNTYVPGTGDEWILNDSYPDKQRLQHPHLYHIPTGRVVPVAAVLQPPEYKGEWRCDTHPCASPDGRFVCFDSTHEAGRQVYLADISGIVASPV